MDALKSYKPTKKGIGIKFLRTRLFAKPIHYLSLSFSVYLLDHHLKPEHDAGVFTMFKLASFYCLKCITRLVASHTSPFIDILKMA